MPAVTAAALVAGVGATAGASIAAGAITAAAISAGLIAFGTTLASGLLARALAEKPDLPDSSPLGAGLQVTGLSPAQPRRILYGRQRVGGQVVLRAATGRQNSLFHQIVVWAGHEVEAIETVYGDDEEMPGNYATLTANDIYFEDLGDEIKSGVWDPDTQEMTGTILDATFTTSGMVIKVSGAPDDQEGRDLNGYYRIKDDPLREDTQNYELNVFRLDHGPISDTSPGPSITLTETYSRIRNHLGTAGQVADAVAVNEIPHWTSAHKLSGCAYTYATLFYSPWHWKSGLPNITAVIKGKKCYDPRKDSTNGGSGLHRTNNPNTWEYTRNSALICADWLTDTVYGLAVPWSNLDLATLISAANVCDETVTTAGDSVARYVTDAAINANEDRRAVLHKLAAAMAGYVVQTGAQWTFQAGAYETPTISLDESDLRSAVQITPKRSRQELFNSASASFRDAALDWQPTTSEPIEDAGAIAQDNGEQMWTSLRYDYTTDREAVTRLMKIELLRNRQQATVNVRVGLSGLAITAGTTIKLSISRYGWTNKPFFVERWGLEQYADDKGAPAIGVGLTLRETDASVYTWGAGEASPTPSPESLPAPDWASMDAPTAITLVSGLGEILTAGDGTLISRIKVTWGMPDGAFSSRFEVRYRRVPSSGSPEEWAYLPADAPTAWISPVKDQDRYDVHVRAFNALGVPSAWTEKNAYLVNAKSGFPSAVAGFQALAARDRIGLSWSANPERDLSHYVIREGANWDAGTLIAKTDATRYQTPDASNGPWWIKAVDTSGNESATATLASLSLELPSITSITGQVVDNNVLLRWVSTPGTFNIQTYEVRKGPNAATAALVGDSDKTFDVVFETASGTYTYWIVPVDAAGNEGASESITLSVDSPPDFILRNSFQTDWEGYTATNAQPLLSVPLPARLTTRDQTAIDGDGVDDYVQVDNSATIDITGTALTIEGKAYFKAFRGGTAAFINKDSSFEVGTNASGLLSAAIQTSAAWAWVSSGISVEAGRWVDFAITYDGTNLFFDVDGETATFAHPDGGAINSTANALHYLCKNPGTGHFAMRMAELRIWDVVRTPTQISDWRDRTLDGNESGLVLYHRAQGGSGDTVSDKSGNGNDGAIVGASWRVPTVRAAIPFPTAETVAQRQSTHGYATPQAQIDAGYPYVAQPVPTTATFEEVYDAGALIPSTKVQVTLAGDDVVAGVTSEITLSTRENEGDPWTDHPTGQTQVFATNFRYVKVKVVYTSDGKAFRDAQDIATVLSTKIKNDSGRVTVSSNPTTVTLNVDFVDIESITATPQGTTAKLAMVDFDDTPYPTGFDVYLFDAAGNATTGDVRWSARGF